MEELEVCRKKKKKKIGKFTKKMKKKIIKNVWKVGKEDPRRVVHALKVGVALTLVSLLYLMEPYFDGVGQNALWAVMTVVVVLEFSAGATLRKGLNRGLGTVIAGSLAFFIEWVAIHSGKILGGIFIGTSIFFIGSTITYMRFIPYIKRNYDYGMLVFLLTFNLITVSSYRVDTVIKIAHSRLYTIGMGIGICLVMSLLVFPIWSGDDLHKSTFTKLQDLSRCIEACVSEYFEDKQKDKETSDSESDEEDMIYKGYKTVLDSKSADELLAMYASWEIRHTRFCHKFPSQQYIKVGSVVRKFGYSVVALHGCLQTEIQTPMSIRVLFKEPCVRVAREISKILLELSDSIKNRRHCSPEILSDSLEVALKDLNTTIKSQPKLFLGSNLHGDITNKHLNGDVSYYNDTTSDDIVSYHNDSNQKAGILGETIDENDSVSPLRVNSVVSLSSLRSAKKTSAKKSSATVEKMRLRKQLSKIAVMKSLEFSEALPFAAFASLLVEMVARLDTVIDEVEELGTIACFKEYDKTTEVQDDKPLDLVVGV